MFFTPHTRAAHKGTGWKAKSVLYTQVTEGSGSMVVTAVGEHSEWGKTMALVRTEAADTPLQGSLAWLAAAIGKLGLTVGILCFVVLMIR